MNGEIASLNERVAANQWHPDADPQLLSIRNAITVVLESIHRVATPIKALEVLTLLKEIENYFLDKAGMNQPERIILPSLESTFSISPDPDQIEIQNEITRRLLDIRMQITVAAALGEPVKDSSLKVAVVRQVIRRILDLTEYSQTSE